MLRLRAEMKVPGKAWLEFEAHPIAREDAIHADCILRTPRPLWTDLLVCGCAVPRSHIRNMASRIASQAEIRRRPPLIFDKSRANCNVARLKSPCASADTRNRHQLFPISSSKLFTICVVNCSPRNRKENLMDRPSDGMTRKSALGKLIVLPALAAWLRPECQRRSRRRPHDLKYQSTPKGKDKCSLCTLFIPGKTQRPTAAVKSSPGRSVPTAGARRSRNLLVNAP